MSSDGGELEAENVGVEGAGGDEGPQEFAGFGVREGEEDALEGVENFEEELAWEDAPSIVFVSICRNSSPLVWIGAERTQRHTQRHSSSRPSAAPL